jgi:hypothetical protein
MLHTVFPPPPLGRREWVSRWYGGLKLQGNRFYFYTYLHPPPCYPDTSSKAKVKNRFLGPFSKNTIIQIFIKNVGFHMLYKEKNYIFTLPGLYCNENRS